MSRIKITVEHRELARQSRLLRLFILTGSSLKSVRFTTILLKALGIEHNFNNYLKLVYDHHLTGICNLHIGVAPITQSRPCVIKIVTFNGGYLMW